MSALADTSCLTPLFAIADSRRDVTIRALSRLAQQAETLVVAQQNFVEFRCVATRPTDVNGLGLTPAQAGAALNRLETQFEILQETLDVYEAWRNLCDRAGVSGKQVHDTRLTAFCVSCNVHIILTWNPKDFRRFLPYVKGLTVYTPKDVMNLP